MNCEQIQEHMSPYLDGAAEPDISREVEDHLAGCENCRRSLEDMRYTLKALNTLGTEEMPAAIKERVRQRIQPAAASTPAPAPRARLWRFSLAVRIAAVLFVALLVGVFWVVQLDRDEQRSGPGDTREKVAYDEEADRAPAMKREGEKSDMPAAETPTIAKKDPDAPVDMRKKSGTREDWAVEKKSGMKSDDAPRRTAMKKKAELDPHAAERDAAFGMKQKGLLHDAATGADQGAQPRPTAPAGAPEAKQEKPQVLADRMEVEQAEAEDMADAVPADRPAPIMAKARDAKGGPRPRGLGGRAGGGYRAKDKAVDDDLALKRKTVAGTREYRIPVEHRQALDGYIAKLQTRPVRRGREAERKRAQTGELAKAAPAPAPVKRVADLKEAKAEPAGDKAPADEAQFAGAKADEEALVMADRDGAAAPAEQEEKAEKRIMGRALPDEPVAAAKPAAPQAVNAVVAKPVVKEITMTVSEHKRFLAYLKTRNITIVSAEQQRNLDLAAQHKAPAEGAAARRQEAPRNAAAPEPAVAMQQAEPEKEAGPKQYYVIRIKVVPDE